MAIKKKKITKNATPWMVTKTVTEINPKNIPTGTYFKGKINGNTVVEGLVHNDVRNKRLYFCQNVYNGSSINNKLGFRFSYVIGYHSTELLNSIKFSPKPSNFKIPVLPPEIAGYYPIICKGYIKIGCKTIKNRNIRELVKHLKD